MMKNARFAFLVQVHTQSRLTAVGLVRLVRAVSLLVAPPVRGDAARVVELVLRARKLARITVGRG